jgi:hypothetical protein
MLAVTANWGLTDGSLGGPRAAAVEGWLDRIEAAIVRGSFDAAGRYRPVDEVVLVIAGDTFDPLFTVAWAGRLRPWHGGRRGRDARLAVAREALRLARRPLGRLARWARHGLIVPAADGRGRPVDTLRHRAEMRVVMLAGDRDRFLTDLAGEAAAWGIQIGLGWSDGRHDVSHGHEFDPAWFSAPTGCAADGWASLPTLAESVVVDLLVPFAIAVRDVGPAWRCLGPGLAQLAAVALDRLPSGIAAVLAALPGSLGAPVATMWARAVEQWLQAARREPPAHDADFDLAAELADRFASVTDQGDQATRPLAAWPWLTTSPPPQQPDRISILGHIAASDPTTGMVGLGTREPSLFLRSRPTAPIVVAPLGPEPQREAIVRVGNCGPGCGVVDAA